MKAAWKLLGSLSLAWVASVSSAATAESESVLRGSELSEQAALVACDPESLIADDQVMGTAYEEDRADAWDDSCDIACGEFCNYCCPPTWKVRAGAVILTREQSDEGMLAILLGGLTQISGEEDFNFGYTAGPDVSIERVLGNGPNSVELRYFGALEWTSQVEYGNTGDIQIGPINIPLAFDVAGNYLSRLNSTEINFRHQQSDRVTWLTGLRIIELHEELSYDVDFIVPNLTGVNWNTDNHMYGAQAGADVQMWRLSGPLSVNGIFKAGIYGNDADNSFTYDVLGTPIIRGNANDNPVAFVGEIGITSSCQVTRHFAVRGGYQLLWISEVALAGDQAQLALNTLDVDAINSSGNVFYHGALVGGEFTW